MIGVIAQPSEYPAVREFFELLKTPWEFHAEGKAYDAVLRHGDRETPEADAKVTVVYGGRRTAFDARHDIRIASEDRGPRVLSVYGRQVPVYGESAAFQVGERQPAMVSLGSPGRSVVRIGYDLFGEIRTLLTVGQPAAYANVPALELHIETLRRTIVAKGVRLAEVPPVPDGYRFIACLTHDVDHPLLSRHRFDATMFGFLYRATVGSALRLLRGRLAMRCLLQNWTAAMKLPLVHLGFSRDIWKDFARYRELEKGAPSTFFVMPFRGRCGRNAPGRRACAYGAQDIADQIRLLVAAGQEIGLHGIDAWCDARAGRAELDEIRRFAGQAEVGSRMHWLYYNQESPAVLEQAGADYDSTVGYNETVGYRAGTTQVYKPFQARRLMELPLHVMDTALFYPCYLNLSAEDAWGRVREIIDQAVEFGGCVTVNWHDRSIAPERLWGGFYSELIDCLRSQGAWFATAAQTVAWFRKRRAAAFDTNDGWDAGDGLPGLQLRFRHEAEPSGATIGAPV